MMKILIKNRIIQIIAHIFMLFNHNFIHALIDLDFSTNLNHSKMFERVP